MAPVHLFAFLRFLVGRDGVNNNAQVDLTAMQIYVTREESANIQ